MYFSTSGPPGRRSGHRNAIHHGPLRERCRLRLRLLRLQHWQMRRRHHRPNPRRRLRLRQRPAQRQRRAPPPRPNNYSSRITSNNTSNANNARHCRKSPTVSHCCHRRQCPRRRQRRHQSRQAIHNGPVYKRCGLCVWLLWLQHWQVRRGDHCANAGWGVRVWGCAAE